MRTFQRVGARGWDLGLCGSPGRTAELLESVPARPARPACRTGRANGRLPIGRVSHAFFLLGSSHGAFLCPVQSGTPKGCRSPVSTCSPPISVFFFEVNVSLEM